MLRVLVRNWWLLALRSCFALLFSIAAFLAAGANSFWLFNSINLALVTFLFGIFAAVYALVEGGLWGICAWHAVWNWAMGDLLGFALDGRPHPGLLVSIRATGPVVISGGDFGLEGGLACTAIFLIAIGIIAMRNRRTEDSAKGER